MRIAHFIDIIKSSFGRTLFKNPAGYDVGTDISTIGDDDFITKSMTIAVGSGQSYKIPAGSPYPSVLTNGVEFSLTSTDFLLQCTIADPETAHKRTTNGAPTLYDIQLNAGETQIETITIQTNTIDGTTVEQDTWVRVV